MATDVRFRLGVEGDAAIIAAFRRIQAESERTGKGMAGAFGGFGSALSSIQGLLGSLGVALSVGAFVNFEKNAAESAEKLGKLSQQLGTSTENMAAFSVAAKLADVDIASSTRSLANFLTTTEKAAEGVGGGARALKTLGFNATEIRDLLGKDLVERLAAVSQKFAQFPDGPQKSAIALQLVGTRGAALIPLMNSIGTEGLDSFKRKAGALGASLDKDVINKITAMNDTFKELGITLNAVGVQFAAGFAPGISKSLQQVNQDIAAGAKGWKEFGEFAGKALGAIALLLSEFTDEIYTFGKALDAALAAKAAQPGKGGLEGLRIGLKAYNDEWDKGYKERQKARNETFKSLFGPEPLPQFGPPVPTKAFDPQQLENLFNDQVAAQKAKLDAELAIRKAQSRLLEQTEQDQFDASLIDLRGYYADRMKIVRDSAADEISVLRQRMAVEAENPDAEKAAADVAKTKSEIAQRELDTKTEILKLQAEETKEARRLGDDQLALIEKVLELQGRRHEAALLQADQEYKKAVELDAKRGPSSPFGPVDDRQRQSLLQAYRDGLTLAADLADVSATANQELNDFSRQREAIQRLAEAGLISEGEAQRRTLELERDRIDSLRAVSEQMTQLAAASGDPEKIQQAAAFADSIDQISVSMETARITSAQLETAFQEALVSGAGTFLTTAIRNAQTFDDVWRSVAASVLDSLNQIIAKLLQLQFASFVAGIFGGGGGGSATGALALPKVPLAGASYGFAEGGLLVGPGTGTSDSMLIAGSTGEFMVREAVVSQPGVLGHLQSLNDRGLSALNELVLHALPRSVTGFAEGGLVQMPHENPRVDGSIDIRLSDGLSGILETPAGERSVIRIVGKHRRTIGSLVR